MSTASRTRLTAENLRIRGMGELMPHAIVLWRIRLPLRQMRRNVNINCVRGRLPWTMYSALPSLAFSP